jgi:hypothetical protein
MRGNSGLTSAVHFRGDLYRRVHFAKRLSSADTAAALCRRLRYLRLGSLLWAREGSVCILFALVINDLGITFAQGGLLALQNCFDPVITVYQLNFCNALILETSLVITPDSRGHHTPVVVVCFVIQARAVLQARG